MQLSGRDEERERRLRCWDHRWGRGCASGCRCRSREWRRWYGGRAGRDNVSCWQSKLTAMREGDIQPLSERDDHPGTCPLRQCARCKSGGKGGSRPSCASPHRTSPKSWLPSTRCLDRCREHRRLEARGRWSRDSCSGRRRCSLDRRFGGRSGQRGRSLFGRKDIVSFTVITGTSHQGSPAPGASVRKDPRVIPSPACSSNSSISPRGLWGMYVLVENGVDRAAVKLLGIWIRLVWPW